MLKAIFGGEDSQPTPPKAPPVASRPMTPDLFDALF
jgi:hypothetical protein